MLLRKLELKDAPLMLAWMHDSGVTQNLLSDFKSKTIYDAEDFIRLSWKDNKNIHLAIASDEDEYMGTVSLKHIEKGSAEFAITVRTEAMGLGYSWFGMECILDKSFSEYGLETVYWCVSKDNIRALKFYEKHNFKETTTIPERILARYEGIDNLKWFSVSKGEEYKEIQFVAGCKVIHIKTIPTEDSGELSFFESKHEIPFEIKRIYYISKVPEGVTRGFHAHKELQQFIFCPYGRIKLVLENKNGRESIELSDSSVGILIDQFTWREMLWIQKDSVLCVAASDYYYKEDYVRDYREFKKLLETDG